MRKYDRDGQLLRNLPEHIRQEFNEDECYNHKWKQPIIIGENGGELNEYRLKSIKERMSANSYAMFIMIIGGNDLRKGKKSLKLKLIVSFTYISM